MAKIMRAYSLIDFPSLTFIKDEMEVHAKTRQRMTYIKEIKNFLVENKQL